MLRSLLFLTVFIVGGCQPQHKPIPSRTQQVPEVPVPQPDFETVAPQEPQMRVGVLLPLTGPHEKIGASLQNAALLSLFERGQDTIELIFKDTKSQPKVALQEAENLIHDGVRLIIGPVFSETTHAMIPLAKHHKVPVLSLSNNVKLKRQGVYPVGFSPAFQTQTIIETARENGAKKMIALLPNNALGRLIHATLKPLDAQNHTQTEVIFYSVRETNFSEKVKPLKDKDFDALFIPEGGETLNLILSALLFHEVDISQTLLLGSLKWGDEKFVTHSALWGGLFPYLDLYEKQNFETRFQKTFAHPPREIDILMYDMVSLAGILATYRDIFQGLTQPRGFNGIQGAFRFHTDGETERTFSVFKITPRGFQLIKPAPLSF